MSAVVAGNTAVHLLIARVLMSAVFLVFGVRGIMGFAGSVGYFTKLGFPAPQAMVVLAIIIEIVGGIALLIGWKTRWAAWLLAASGNTTPRNTSRR
jgi:putative oxidoreductase